MESSNESFQDLTFENAFDNLDIDISPPAPPAPSEEITADLVEEPAIEPEEASTEETPAEEVEEETEDSEEPAENTEEKPSGAKNLRDFGNRQKARADEAEAKLQEIEAKKQVFEELGGYDASLEVIKQFGGVESAKIGYEIAQVFSDTETPVDTLLDKLHNLAPQAVDNAIAHVAESLFDTVHQQVLTNIFGRVPNEEEITRLREVAIFGTTGNDLPEDLTVDQYGNPLPDNVVATLKASREQLRQAQKAVQNLEAKIDGRFATLENDSKKEQEQKFMQNTFSVVGEKLQTLHLLPTPGEDEASISEKTRLSGVLNALTFHFFQSNPEADKAFNQATTLLGKNDAVSKARLTDLNRSLQRHARKAGEEAAAIVAGMVSDKAATQVTAVTKQQISKTTPAAGRTRSAARLSASSDPFDEVTLDTL